MKQMVLLSILVFVGVAAWRIGGSLSSDAVGMAVGVVFGVLAGLPTALLLLAGRRRDRAEEPRGRHVHGQAPYPYSPQPPVIVLTGPAMQPHAVLPEAQAPLQQAPPPPERHFRFVGVPAESNER